MDLAKTFYERFLFRHRVPEIILSDNGPSFNSQFNTELSKFIQADWIYSPPYHPASNGLVERYMQTLKQFLLVISRQDTIQKEWGRNLRLL